MATTVTEPVASSYKSLLADTIQEQKELRDSAATLRDQLAEALANQDATSVSAIEEALSLTEKRQAHVALMLNGSPNHPELGLRHRSEVETRTELIQAVYDAQQRTQINAKKWREAVAKANEAQKVADSALAEANRLRAVDSGRYNAQLALKRHRDAFPTILDDDGDSLRAGCSKVEVSQ